MNEKAEFRVALADLNAPEAVAMLISVFEAAGCSFDPANERDRALRHYLATTVATWAYNLPTECRFEDPESRALIEEAQRAANHLSNLLQQIKEYGDRPETDKVNVCSYLFDYEDSYDYVQEALFHLSVGTLRITERFYGDGLGLQKEGRGRPPLLAFHRFIRELHEVYVAKAGQPGWYPSDGTALGPFVELVHAAQKILPKEMRQDDIRTTGYRVLSALKENSS